MLLQAFTSILPQVLCTDDLSSSEHFQPLSPQLTQAAIQDSGGGGLLLTVKSLSFSVASVSRAVTHLSSHLSPGPRRLDWSHLNQLLVHRCSASKHGLSINCIPTDPSLDTSRPIEFILATNGGCCGESQGRVGWGLQPKGDRKWKGNRKQMDVADRTSFEGCEGAGGEFASPT